MFKGLHKNIKDPTFHLLKFGIIFRKPILVFKTAWQMFRYAVLRKETLRAVDFAVDYKCNFNCEHCFAEAFRKNKTSQPLSLDEIKEFIGKCVDDGILHISFQGGEILFYQHLDEIITACKPHKTYVSLTSNGYFVTDEKVRHLKKLGLDEIRISIDSFNPDEHNKFRNKENAFQKAMEAIQIIQRNGLNLQINVTISHVNLHTDGIQELIKYCVAEKISLGILQAIPAGKWRGNTDIMLNAEDLKYLKELNRKYPFIKRDVDYMFFREGCPAVRRVVYVTAYGDVLPCPFTHIKIGNIREAGLRDIREKALNLEYYQKASKVCWLVENRDFYEKFVIPTFDAEHLPLDGEKLFFNKPDSSRK